MKVYIATDEDYQPPKDCLKEIDIDKLVGEWLSPAAKYIPFSKFIEEKCK